MTFLFLTAPLALAKFFNLPRYLYDGNDAMPRAVEGFFNSVYEYLYDMQTLEIDGFRRMRTITQLFYESLIQIIVQALQL